MLKNSVTAKEWQDNSRGPRYALHAQAHARKALARGIVLTLRPGGQPERGARMTTWLVCGGREFTDRSMLNRTLADLIASRGRPAKLVHGGARGADTMAGEFGERAGLPTVAVMADWALGRKAGPIRNQRMLDEHKPSLVIAFPGGRGTADMVRRAGARASM